MQWKEEFSRDLARVLMEQYSSVADALFELVDNPVDFRRRGTPLEVTIEVDKEQDSIVVEDHGGAGMDEKAIAQWLKWGIGQRDRSKLGILVDGVSEARRRPVTWQTESKCMQRPRVGRKSGSSEMKDGPAVPKRRTGECRSPFRETYRFLVRCAGDPGKTATSGSN